MRNLTVSIMPLLATLGCSVEDDGSLTGIVCTACVVWITHIGLTKMVVAEPAIVPVEKLAIVKRRVNVTCVMVRRTR